MPNSLKSRLKGLVNKGLLSEKDLLRIYTDNDVVEELEKIKAEILKYHCIKCYDTCEIYCPYNECIESKDVIKDLRIIDKHISELKGE